MSEETTATSKFKMLTNEDEIALLKANFAENQELLTSIRALMLGYQITKGEADVIRSVFSDKHVAEAFRKKLYPILSPTSLIGQGGDYWFGTDGEILGRDPETIKQIVISKHKALTMLEHAMKLLKNPTLKPIDISVSLDFEKDPFQINLLARNKYVHAVGMCLNMVKAVAGLKNETAEQTKDRLMRESSK